jgi:subtilase family serine protease
MKEPNQIPISAQVVVIGRNRKKMEGNTLITSENVSQYSSDEKTINELTRIFSESGFDTGPAYGISLSITASRQVFEKFLEVGIYSEEDGLNGFILKGKKAGTVLKNEFLPEKIRDRVESITFSLPPDFGPDNW